MTIDKLQRFLLSHSSKPAYQLMNEERLASYIAPQTARYAHILGVVNMMQELCQKRSIPKKQTEWLIQSAFLHDIGYSPTLANHQYHPVDGTIFAYEQGFPKPVLAAVLFHSEAMRTRSLSSAIVTLYEKNYPLLDKKDQFFIDMITYCDLHCSPHGQRVTLDERVNEVVVRYGADHEVSQQMLHNMKYYLRTVERVQIYLSQK